MNVSRIAFYAALYFAFWNLSHAKPVGQDSQIAGSSTDVRDRQRDTCRLITLLFNESQSLYDEFYTGRKEQATQIPHNFSNRLMNKLSRSFPTLCLNQDRRTVVEPFYRQLEVFQQILEYVKPYVKTEIKTRIHILSDKISDLQTPLSPQNHSSDAGAELDNINVSELGEIRNNDDADGIVAFTSYVLSNNLKNLSSWCINHLNISDNNTSDDKPTEMCRPVKEHKQEKNKTKKGRIHRKQKQGPEHLGKLRSKRKDRSEIDSQATKSNVKADVPVSSKDRHGPRQNNRRDAKQKSGSNKNKRVGKGKKNAKGKGSKKSH